MFHRTSNHFRTNLKWTYYAAFIKNVFLVSRKVFELHQVVCSKCSTSPLPSLILTITWQGSTNQAVWVRFYCSAPLVPCTRAETWASTKVWHFHSFWVKMRSDWVLTVRWSWSWVWSWIWSFLGVQSLSER